MRRPARIVILGMLAATMLVGLAAGVWVFGTTPAPRAVPRAQPGPAEAARIAEAPEGERCRALLQRDPEAARSLAQRWEAEGGGDGARHCLALAILALGQPVQAAERLEQLATRSQAGAAARAAVFAQATQAWLMAGLPARAYAAATLALTLAPEDVDLLIDRAVALGAFGRYREAVEDLDRALAIEADRAEALVFRAAAWRHLDRAALALRDIERALALSPTNAEALLERGIIRHLRGDPAGARADWERTIELAPGSAAADLATQNLALSDAGPGRR